MDVLADSVLMHTVADLALLVRCSIFGDDASRDGFLRHNAHF
jgi:hypothetical protein